MSVDASRLRIVSYPAPILRRPARPITQITDEIRQVADKMLQLMHDAPGVGLAAPQVGLDWRLFVANATGDRDDDQVFVNPVLSDPSPEMADMEEGCLSLADIRAPIRRPVRITLTARDLDGHPVQLTDDGMPARIWQHETDHLDGVLILDRMAPLDQRANRRAIRELEKGV